VPTPALARPAAADVCGQERKMVSHSSFAFDIFLCLRHIFLPVPFRLMRTPFRSVPFPAFVIRRTAIIHG
jgi:hypothetical protein